MPEAEDSSVLPMNRLECRRPFRYHDSLQMRLEAVPGDLRKLSSAVIGERDFRP